MQRCIKTAALQQLTPPNTRSSKPPQPTPSPPTQPRTLPPQSTHAVLTSPLFFTCNDGPYAFKVRQLHAERIVPKRHIRLEGLQQGRAGSQRSYWLKVVAASRACEGSHRVGRQRQARSHAGSQQPTNRREVAMAAEQWKQNKQQATQRDERKGSAQRKKTEDAARHSAAQRAQRTCWLVCTSWPEMNWSSSGSRAAGLQGHSNRTFKSV